MLVKGATAEKTNGAYCLLTASFTDANLSQWFKVFTFGKVVLAAFAHCVCGLGKEVAFFSQTECCLSAVRLAIV